MRHRLPRWAEDKREAFWRSWVGAGLRRERLGQSGQLRRAGGGLLEGACRLGDQEVGGSGFHSQGGRCGHLVISGNDRF